MNAKGAAQRCSNVADNFKKIAYRMKHGKTRVWLSLTQYETKSKTLIFNRGVQQRRTKIKFA